MVHAFDSPQHAPDTSAARCLGAVRAKNSPQRQGDFVMDTRKPTKTDNRKIKDAESYHQSFTERYPDLVTYQKEFSYGQARINFELNAVDIDVLKTLRVIVAALEKLKNMPELTSALGPIDFTAICAALTDAENRSNSVASIRPPGCEPYPA